MQQSIYKTGENGVPTEVITMLPLNRYLVKVLLTCVALGLPIASQAASDDIEREFDVAPGGTLMLESDAGSVDVNTWDQARVRVRVRNPGGYEVDIRQSGNDVQVQAGSQRGFLGFGRNNIGFTVDVPRTYNIDLDTGGGSIKIADINGRIDAETSGGSIDVGNTTGGVKADTSGGRITILNVEGDVEADTSGGSITIGDVIGNVDADTSGGRIKIGNVSGDILADTSGGNIEVGEGGGRVQLDTSGGTIRAAWAQGPIQADTSGGHIYLAGSSSRIDADTSGGNIVIESSDGPVNVETSGGSITVRSNVGPLRADTAGGRIEVDLGNASGSLGGSVDLETAGGDIILRLPATIGVTIDAVLEVSRRGRGDYRIYTDFPLSIQEDDSNIVGRGDINGGGDRISLRTKNSDISIVRVGN